MNVKPPAVTTVVLPFTHPRTIDREHPHVRRLPGAHLLPDTVRNHVVAMLGEFAGTFLFLFFAFSGTQLANMSTTAAQKGPQPGVLLYIALSFGFSLAVNAWVFFRISGGLFNPAVTLGLCLIGAVGWIRGLLVVMAQTIGAIAASALVFGLFPGPLLVQTRLSQNPKTTVTRGLFIEMFLTAELIFAIFMLAAEKHKATFLAPIGIGLALFIAELAGVYWTGGSLNPARSFGPDVVMGQFDGSHWVYWLGPALGALLAVLFYRLVKILEYETSNPGQDNTGDPPVSPIVSPAVPGHDGATENGAGYEETRPPHLNLKHDGTEPLQKSNSQDGQANELPDSITRAGQAARPSQTDGTFSRSSDAEKGHMPSARY